MTDLATLVVRMQADNSQYVKALEQSAAKLEKFSKDAEGALSSIKEQFAEIGGKLAAAFTIDKIIEFSSSAIESAASLEKLSESAGISVESLSSLRLAAAASGLSQEELGKALKKLNVNLSEAAGNANSKAGVAFKALGIDVTDASGHARDAGSVMEDLASKFSNLADGPNKAALAVQLFGREGVNLIPVLNRGAEGLEEFKKQAKDAGLEISGSTAAAAEEFEQKLNVLKATLVDGLGAQIAAKLLPILSQLVESFESSGGASQFLSGIATVLGVALKLIGGIVIETAGEFTKMGQSIGAAAAAAVAAAHGEFSEAARIWKQSNEDNIETTRKTNQALADLYESGSEQQLAIISTTEAEKHRIKSEAPNVTALEEQNKAIEELKKYSAELKAQAATFGLGKAALIDYKLQFGPLADQIKLAGDEGKKLAAQIRANAALLQTKTDDKMIKDATDKLKESIITYGQSTLAAEKFKNTNGELGEALDRMADHGVAARAELDGLAKAKLLLEDADAIKAIDRETLTMTGHLKEAALAAYDFQNKALIKNVKDTGSAEDNAKIDRQRALAGAQGEFNEQVEKARAIETQLKTLEDDIELDRIKGHITDMDAEAKLQAARADSIVQLQAIQQNEMAIATAIKDPKLVESANAFGASIKGIQKQTNALEENVRDHLEQSFADNFEKLIDGSESFKKACMNMLRDLDKMFLDMIAKNYAQKLFGTDGPAGGAAGWLSKIMSGASGSGSGGSGLTALSQNGGAGGGIGNIVGSLDGYADGGTIPIGKFGIVGEEGPELAYSGSQNMNIAPISSASAKPITVHNQFIVSAPGGTISRQSQMQTAAAAARSLGQANRRNNA